MVTAAGTLLPSREFVIKSRSTITLSFAFFKRQQHEEYHQQTYPFVTYHISSLTDRQSFYRNFGRLVDRKFFRRSGKALNTSLNPTMDHTSDHAVAAPLKSSHYRLWPSDKLQKDVLRTMPPASSSKENLPLWQRHSIHMPQIHNQGKFAALSAASSLNVQRLRARPSIDTSIQRLALKNPNTVMQQEPSTRPDTKRRKSIHKRVMSRVRDGVLGRSKSSSRFPSGTGGDQPGDKGLKLSNTRQRQQASRARLELCDADLDKGSAKHTKSSLCCGDLTISMIKLDSSVRSRSRSPALITPAVQSNKAPVVHDDQTPKLERRRPAPVSAHRTHATHPNPVCIQLSVRPSSRHIGVDDGIPTWFTVSAKVIGTSGEIRGLTLSIDAGIDGRIHTVLGPLSIMSMSCGDVTELRVKLSPKAVCQRLRRRDSTQSTFDDLCSELESMLGDALTELMVVKACYTHSLLTKETYLTTEYSLKVRHSDPTIPTVPDQSYPGPGHDKQIENASNSSGISPPSSPPSCETSMSTADDDRTVHHKPDNASTPTQPSPDAARRVWNHIRRDSKSAAELLDFDAGKLEDEAVTAMRKQALANKRSVGAETLRDWQTITGSRQEHCCMEDRRVAHVPWL